MRHVDLHALIDHAKFQRFHWIVLIWCTLIIIFDGYDLAVAGAALAKNPKVQGLGFAAENRRVISQVMPDLFQESSLHHLDPYFAASFRYFAGESAAAVVAFDAGCDGAVA